MAPIERLLAKLPDAKPAGKGWSACCPAHEDRRASLSIAEGADGRVLVKCHAGCTADAICLAIGLRLSDLMGTPDHLAANTANVNGIRRSPKKTGVPLTPKSKRVRKKFATAKEAVAELELLHGPRSTSWTYHDAQGQPIGVVVRWNLPNGKKDIRPASRHVDGWRLGGMPEPRPLYGLPDLSGAERVYVCEGEKAADAARSIGLTATTSAHGCESPRKTDWRPLAGKKISILPDNDPPGRKYANAVADLLVKLTPPAEVNLVQLPDLPEHGDAADFVAAHPEATAGELRSVIESLSNEAKPWRPSVARDRFVPFPVDALPETLRDFVAAGAKSIGCDPSYLALPLLTALASAIGNSRRLVLKRGWAVAPILWVAIVGESGTAKTPAFKVAMRPVRERQRKAFDRHAEAMQQYEAALAHYEKELSAWKRDKKTLEDPPEKPKAPDADRFIVSDTTVEALAPLLLSNPRGLLLARDELAGWIGSFDRYVGGKGGADAAHWLSMHNGESLFVDRKTGVPRTIYVPHAAVCVCGGIQPAILHRALGCEHRESGLAARLLLTCPPRLAKRWTEADIDPAAEAKISRLADRLYDLQPTKNDDGEMHPLPVDLTADAKSAWKAYYNSHAQEQIDLAGDLAAAWSKLEEYAARLALVLHLARWAADDPTLASADVVDVHSMAAGIRLANWFKGEARRVYELLSESDDDRVQRRLVEWIERRGGTVTSRDAQMGCRWLREAGAAGSALEHLVKAGWGTWEPTPAGRCGQPTRHFCLSMPSVLPSVNGITVRPEENSNSADVAKIADPPPQAECDWGEL